MKNNNIPIFQRVILGFLYGPIGGVLAAIVLAAFADRASGSFRGFLENAVILGSGGLIGGYIGILIIGLPLFFLLHCSKTESVIPLAVIGFVAPALLGLLFGIKGALLFGYFGLAVATTFGIFTIHLPNKIPDLQRFKVFFAFATIANIALITFCIAAYYLIPH